MFVCVRKSVRVFKHMHFFIYLMFKCMWVYDCLYMLATNIIIMVTINYVSLCYKNWNLCHQISLRNCYIFLVLFFLLLSVLATTIKAEKEMRMRKNNCMKSLGKKKYCLVLGLRLLYSQRNKFKEISLYLWINFVFNFLALIFSCALLMFTNFYL